MMLHCTLNINAHMKNTLKICVTNECHFYFFLYMLCILDKTIFFPLIPVHKDIFDYHKSGNQLSGLISYLALISTRDIADFLRHYHLVVPAVASLVLSVFKH